MPFTPAHPAAVLPLMRRGFVPSALIVGSMAPDFEYFLRGSLQTGRSWHDLHGGILWCIPAGLVALWCYHRILKIPLLALLPPAHRRRLRPCAGAFHFLPPRRFAWIALSLMLGALTHAGWDFFTHTYGWHGAPYAWLTTPIVAGTAGAVCVRDVLQAASTALGGLALLWSYRSWFLRAPLPDDDDHIDVAPYRYGVAAAMVVVALLAGLTAAPLRPSLVANIDAMRVAGGRAVVTTIAVFALECLFFGVGWHCSRRLAPFNLRPEPKRVKCR